MESSNETEKRTLIYVDERLKEVVKSQAALQKEQSILDTRSKDWSEEEKRRRIYIGEHLQILQSELAELVSKRQQLMELLT